MAKQPGERYKLSRQDRLKEIGVANPLCHHLLLGGSYGNEATATAGLATRTCKSLQQHEVAHSKGRFIVQAELSNSKNRESEKMEDSNSQSSTKKNGGESNIGNGKLASRVDRLLGALVDVGVMFVPMAIVYIILGFVLYFVGIDFTTFLGQTIFTIIASVCGIALFLAINFQFLSTRGQTVGKMIIGTRIVAEDGSLIPIDQLILKRYLLLWGVSVVLSIIPYIGLIMIIDPLMIFRENHKCLHDELAGSKVISLK